MRVPDLEWGLGCTVYLVAPLSRPDAPARPVVRVLIAKVHEEGGRVTAVELEHGRRFAYVTVPTPDGEASPHRLLETGAKFAGFELWSDKRLFRSEEDRRLTWELLLRKMRACVTVPRHLSLGFMLNFERALDAAVAEEKDRCRTS